MIRCWHVLRTYLGRKRFWILGGMLLIWLAASSRATGPEPPEALMLLTVPTIFTNILMAFLALHLRRQFGTPQARLMPAFAGPHLLVAALLATLVWAVWPVAMAWRQHYTPWPMISAHALGAVVFALVVWWPKAFVVVAFVPAVFVMLVGDMLTRPEESFTKYFAAGQTPLTYAVLVSLAVVAYPLAAWNLLRLDDLSSGSGDDIVMEPRPSDYTRGKYLKRISEWRDGQIEWQLGHVRRRGASVAWRRVPSAASWTELLLFVGAILLMMAAFVLITSEPAASWVIMTVGAGLMLFAPLSLWRYRCNSLSTEALLPATRRDFARQLVVAMGLDFVTWTSAASVVTVVGDAMLWKEYGISGWGLAAHLAILWGMATAIYGVGIVTLRFRYWLPVFVALFMGTLVVSFFVASIAELLYVAADRTHANGGLLLSIVAPTTLAVIGLVFAWLTYHSWEEIDLT